MWTRTAQEFRRFTARRSTRRYARPLVVLALVLALVMAIGSSFIPRSEPPQAAAESIVLWQSPTHDCCRKWASYMQTKGYRVSVYDVADILPVKESFGVPAAVRSCHTAAVAAYLIEGHVPAGAVAKLLDERPALQGIAVPGMPAGPPGMGGSPGRYRVIGFTAEGQESLFADVGKWVRPLPTTDRPAARP